MPSCMKIGKEVKRKAGNLKGKKERAVTPLEYGRGTPSVGVTVAAKAKDTENTPVKSWAAKVIGAFPVFEEASRHMRHDAGVGVGMLRGIPLLENGKVGRIYKMSISCFR